MKFKNLLAAVLFVCAFTSAKAQLSAGGGVSFPFDLGELGLLGRATYDFDDTWRGAGTFTYYLDGIEGLSFWSIDFDANYNIGGSESVAPYLLAGISVFNAGVDLGPFGSASASDVGVSLGGGALFPVSSFNIFGEGRLRIAGGTDIVLTGGILVPFN